MISVTAALLLVLVACGGNGGGQSTAALNGQETKTGPEVQRAAAEALRAVKSVHIQDASFDLRLTAPGGAIGTFSGKNDTQLDLIRVDGVTYTRLNSDAPTGTEGSIVAGQWIRGAGSEADEFTITSLADDLARGADHAKPEVQRTTEAGQPALLVESADGSKLWVANVGRPLPLRKVDARGAEVTFTEYDADVFIEAPSSDEVLNPPSS
jgi:hypothetical protein